MFAAPATAAVMGSTSARAEDSAAEPAAEPGDPVLVGRIVRPHGVRGGVKIEIWSDVPERFDPGRELLLLPPADPIADRYRNVRIASFSPQRGGAIVRFDDCLSREQAEELRGSRLAVPRSEVPVAPEGLYYHFDLVGCRCIDAEHGDLGVVRDVLEDGGGALLEVEKADRTLPIPFVETFLESVDVAGKQIRLRLPPGLIEACESRS